MRNDRSDTVTDLILILGVRVSRPSHVVRLRLAAVARLLTKHFTVKSDNSAINAILELKGDLARDGVQSEHPQEDHGHQR